MSAAEAVPEVLTRQEWQALIAPILHSRRPRALRLCGEALKQFPGALEFNLYRAGILIELGRGDEAAPDLDRALELGRRNDKILLKLARLFAQLGRLSETLELVERVLGRDQVMEELREKAARILLDCGDFDAALRASASPGANEILAVIHEEARKGIESDAAHGVQPDPKRRNQRAVEQLRQGRPDEAEREFAALAQADPGQPLHWMGWRGALEAQGKATAAQDLMRAWAAAAPGSAAIKTYGARRLGRRGMVFDPRESHPVRTAAELLRPVRTSAELKAGEDVILILDPGGQPMELDPVISLDGSGEDRFVIRHVSSQQFVAAVEGAALLGRGAVAVRQGEIIEESLGSKPAKSAARRSDDLAHFQYAAFRDGVCQVQAFDTPAFLMTGPTDASFGDWMVNFAPRLALAEAAGLDCPVVLRKNPMSSALDCLAALGVSRDRVIFHDPEGVSLFTRLYVPSWPLPRRNRPMADLFGVYRRVRQRPTSGPRDRIYLTRGHIANRQLVNELEVRELFEARGFRVVRPEHLSFEEMLEVFARPACVAGPYGSAFLNVAYCIEPPIGLALMPPEPKTYVEELGFWLGGCGARFGYLYGEAVDPQLGPKGTWTIDIARVDAAIEVILGQL